jgi:glycosyltransferase involved in cell wall biosynthesis
MISDLKKSRISLIVPIQNETESLLALIESINQQTLPPDEIILVDGGSTDGTAALARELTAANARYRIIEAGNATPGRGRNVGTENAHNDWIAYTDAGIRLEIDWLEQLALTAAENPNAAIVYGNYVPVADGDFERVATVVCVAPLNVQGTRDRFIASSLMKKEVWLAVGGFPDFRASEDGVFMETAERKGFKHVFAPSAKVYWSLSPGWLATFRKFTLYSKHSVLAGRQRHWHYGVFEQYMIVSLFVALTILHSWSWLAVILLWLAARTFKKMLQHRRQFGAGMFFNPLFIFEAALLILTLDLATFIGWYQALDQGKSGIASKGRKRFNKF